MQDFASELTELELGLEGLEGLEPMPDASLLTLATLIYCSLAFVGVFLRQQDEVGVLLPRRPSFPTVSPAPNSKQFRILHTWQCGTGLQSCSIRTHVTFRRHNG
jgi:hypothetical protein